MTVKVPLEFSAECVCFRSDGRQMAAADADAEGRIHIIELDGRLSLRESASTHIAFSRSERLVRL